MDLLNGEVYNPRENFTLAEAIMIFKEDVTFSSRVSNRFDDFVTLLVIDLTVLLVTYRLYVVRYLDDSKCVGKDSLIEVLCWNLSGKGKENLENPYSR
jgi:hypothetical protein